MGSEKGKTVPHKYLKIAVLLLIAFLLELTVFNIQHWRTVGNTEVEVPVEQSVVQGMLGHTADGKVVLGEDNCIQFSAQGMPEKVCTVAFQAYCADGNETWWGYMRTQYAEISSTMVSLDMVLSEGAENTVLRERLLKGHKGEWDVITLPAGKTPQIITLQMSGVKGSQIVISGIRLNMQSPFRFKAVRVLALFLFMLFIYGFRPGTELWERQLLSDCDNMKWWRRGMVLCVMLVLTVGIPLLISNNQVYMQSEGDFHPYTDLARALAAGQTSLLEMPSEELLAVENPYDPGAREDIQAPFRLDYAYYEGKYYIYFGVIPCLILYLPYYMITGSDLPGIIALTVMLLLCYAGLWSVICRFIRRYAQQTSVAMACLLWLGSGAALSLPAAMGDACNYYAPMLSAVFFILFGMNFTLAAADSLMEAPEKRKGKVLLAAGSLCMACVAGCRPQLVLGAVCTLPVLFPLLLPQKDGKIKPDIGNIICFALPYVLVAAGLMLYNAVRFGSPMDFGAMYNLTFAYLTEVAFHWEAVGAGLYYYLLRPLTLVGKYPYLDRSSLEWSNPSMLASHPSIGGMFMLYPLMILGGICFFPGWKGKDKEVAMVGGSSFILIPVIASVTAVMGGLMDRYRMDISVFAALAFICAALLLGVKPEINVHKRLWQGVLLAAVVMALIISGLTYATEGLNSLYLVNPEVYNEIAGMIEFWR